MEKINITPVGRIAVRGDETVIELKQEYCSALTGLEGFGYIQVLWWFDGCDNQEARTRLVETNPYRKGPAVLGTFATRSPERPNPLALSCAYVTYIDQDNGVVGLAYIDADDGSPVLDIKPYTPSLDRVASPSVPQWCQHWPKSCEESGDFDWAAEFNF